MFLKYRFNETEQFALYCFGIIVSCWGISSLGAIVQQKSKTTLKPLQNPYNRFQIMSLFHQVLLCECAPGWSGEFCEVDYDACEGGPCYLGVECMDEPPPSMNSTCGDCPEGLEGDGKICTGKT